MKKLLILGGIALSREIIEQARRMGIHVDVTDYLANSPAKPFADNSFMVSATDVDAVVKLIEDEKVDGILTGYVDLLLPYYVGICEKAGLPCYATEEQIAATTDKFRFKSLCRNHSVSVVEEYGYEEVMSGSVRYPLLVKPVDNSGARGVFICRNEEEFVERYAQALAYSSSGRVLIERYVNGKESTIFYFFHKGKAYLMGVGDRIMLRFNQNKLPLPVGYVFPSASLPEFESRTDGRLREMFRSIGINEGMAFIQSFVEDGEYVIYEMGYRLTGSLEHHLIAHATGFNPMETMVNFAVGNEIDDAAFNLIDPQKGALANVTLLLTPGVIEEYRGLDDVRSLDGVLHVFTSYPVGTEIRENVVGTLAQVAVRVLLTADNRRGLIEKMDRVKELIQVIDACGKDMLIKDYAYSDLIN